jgi:hypothetical protein
MHPRICLARILALTAKLSATPEGFERQAILRDLDFYFDELKHTVLDPLKTQGPCVNVPARNNNLE